MTATFSRPLILGHRGAPRLATENTLRSLALALEHGADGVEIDVQRSRDGVPVVIHDETLDRTTRARGRVSDLPWPAIERLTGALVPSFEQVVAWASASGAWLNVELKAPSVEEAVVQILSRGGLMERTIVSSFDAAILSRVASVAPELSRFFLTDRWNAAARMDFLRSRAEGVCLRVSAARAAVLAELRASRTPVIVWTVNRPGRMRELLGSGVAGIISDDPGRAVRERDTLLDG